MGVEPLLQSCIDDPWERQKRRWLGVDVVLLPTSSGHAVSLE